MPPISFPTGIYPSIGKNADVYFSNRHSLAAGRAKEHQFLTPKIQR
jgi:hypothetical protein